MRGIQAFFPPARKEQAVSDNPSRLLLERWLDRKKRSFDLVLTEDILDEYKEVLNRLRIRAVHTGNLIASLRSGCMLVQPWCSVEISPDPADNIFFRRRKNRKGPSDHHIEPETLPARPRYPDPLPQ